MNISSAQWFINNCEDFEELENFDSPGDSVCHNNPQDAYTLASDNISLICKRLGSKDEKSRI